MKIKTKIGAIVSTLFFVSGVVQAAALEEIIVTATKRSESMQSVPLSISAITGDDLAARGDVDFFDYATSIPNLSFGAATDGVLAGRSISIRGIAGANTTGVYIDDTPISETIDPRILDLDRIEVLRGPSGTLYGARSLGGTIRQITKKPVVGETFSKVRAGISSTNESDDLNYIVSGDINLPMGERSAVKLSALYEDEGGVFDRAVGSIPDHLGAPATLAGAPTSINEDVDSQSTVALQAAFMFEVNDSLTIQPRVMYQKTELDGFPLADIETDNFTQNRDFDTAEFAEDEWTLTSLNVNYQTSAGTFTSATSYFDRETFEGEGSGSFINFLQALPGEAGGFGLFEVIGVQPVTSPIFRNLTFETTVQEFRFASDLEGPTNFVVGAFYQDTDEERNFIPRNFARGLQANFQTLLDIVGDPTPVDEVFPFGDLVFTSAAPSQTEELGIFGEVTFQLGDKTSLLLGGRWYDTEVNFETRRAGLAFGVPLADDVPLSTLTPETGQQKEDGTIFKAALEYQATDDLFIYASIAEGFRLGGANTTIPNTLGCPEDLASLGLSDLDTSQFQSDDLTNYEIGIRSDLSDSTRLNATAFFIEFDGIQQPVQLACGFQFVGNFGAAESKGLEVEFTTQLNDNFLLNANVGYTDAEFTETVFGGSVNTAGDPLQFVPEVTASLAMDYSTGAAAYRDMEFFARADVSYVDESISLVNGIVRPRDSYEQIGLRLGLRNEKNVFTLFVRNLTDDIANLADNRSLAAETPGRPRFVVSRPRTIGLEYSTNF